MNCPHCGWGMEIEDEGVNLDGYYATLTCKNSNLIIKNAKILTPWHPFARV